MNISNNTEELISEAEKLNNFERIYGGDIKPGYFNMKIIDKEKKKVFEIIGNNYSKDVWEDILVSIKEK